jgi:hypothetical protein
MNEAILRNENGVEISESHKFGEHYVAVGATCWCGDGLLVAPIGLGPDHKKGDPVMVCKDFAHAAFGFKELVMGKQANPNPPEELFAGEKIEKWKALGLAIDKKEEWALFDYGDYMLELSCNKDLKIIDLSTDTDIIIENASYSLVSELVKNFKPNTKGE